ncbi:MAG: carbon storage regulator [Thermogutta sp.]|nr:carbon storage regulator [Thermogutta sp.]
MLVLSRKNRQSVVVGGSDGFQRLLKVTVLGIQGTTVKLGFEVDPDVPVHRSEVWERLQAGGQREGPESSPPAANQEMGRRENEG